MGMFRIEDWSAVATLATMAFTGWAAWAAARAARAATSANAITEASDQRRDRAYIAVQPGGIVRSQVDDQAVGHVTLLNVGRMPARNVRIFVKMEDDIQADRREFIVPPVLPDAERSLHPDAQLTQGSQSLNPEILSGPQGVIFVFGVAYYDDGFGGERHTRFCHRYPMAARRRRVSRLEAKRFGAALLTDDQSAALLFSPEDARHHEFGNDAD